MKEQPLILLVDDDPIILELMREILSYGSYGVDVARNGRVAVERLQACSRASSQRFTSSRKPPRLRAKPPSPWFAATTR